MAGHRPPCEPLILVRGADLAHTWTLAAADPDIPAAATARIEFTKPGQPTVIATWPVTVDTRTLSVRVESEVCDALPDNLTWWLMVEIPQSPDALDVCLMHGHVSKVR